MALVFEMILVEECGTLLIFSTGISLTLLCSVLLGLCFYSTGTLLTLLEVRYIL